VLTYYSLLILAWIGAWLLHERLATAANLTGARDLAYWTAAKLAIWVLPVVVLARVVFATGVIDGLALRGFRRGLRIGTACGLIFVGLAVIFDLAFRAFAWPTLSWGFLSAIVMAPLFEEVVFRGFLLRWLIRLGSRFWPANAAAALMFLGLHVPGWYFMGALTAGQSVVAASIFLVGLIAGSAQRRADSTWAAIVFHGVNNLYAAFLV
jgi:membrane protease YdiL (CAAX protease family)